MSIITPNLDYSDRDFDSLRFRLQALIRTQFPQWTDFNVANFGNIITELFSYVGDTLHYYQDNQAGEMFWPTLTQRISAIRQGRLINFTMRGAASASGAITVSLPYSIPVGQTLPIPEGTRVSTSDPEGPKMYRVTSAAVLSAGTSIDVQVEQAELVGPQMYVSNDEPNQEIVLQRTPYLDDSAIVSAADGSYTEVDTLLEATSTDRIYRVLVDQFYRAHIVFGNGATGTIPQGSISITYKVGGGLEGNAEAGRVNILMDQLFFSPSGESAPASITNAEELSGGADAMTVEEARELAPASLRVLTRCVSRADFASVATRVRGVARALLVTSNEYSGIQENEGTLYVVAQGIRLASGRIKPAAPSATLTALVESIITTDYPPTTTFNFETISAVFKDLTVYARIYLKQGASQTTVGANIRAALEDFFAAQLSNGLANPDIDFGANLVNAVGTPVGEIAWSDVFNAVRDIVGVRKIDEGPVGFLIDGVRKSPVLTPIEFPRLTSVSLVNADTGVSF